MVQEVPTNDLSVDQQSPQIPAASSQRKFGDPSRRGVVAHPVRSGCDINFLRKNGMHGMSGQ